MVQQITVIGLTGKVGSRIAAEAASRGIDVIGVSRRPPADAPPPHVRWQQGDVHDTASLLAACRGSDAVVHAYRPAIDSEDRPGQQRNATLSIIEATRQAGVGRLLAVGGAGSLTIDGMRYMDHPSFPPGWKIGGITTYLVKELLEAQDALDWTFICPPGLLTPGERTGRYRTALDDLVIDAQGKSWISIEDYAVGFVDELQQPRHPRRRFAVGY